MPARAASSSPSPSLSRTSHSCDTRVVTGVSKGAALTHGNLVANVLQMEAWIVPALHDTSRGPVPGQFVYICALPLYHVFALVVNCLFGMRIGTLNVLIADPRDIAGFVRELGEYKFNVLPGVNTLYNALLGNEDFRKLDFSSLRVANGGGMAVQKRQREVAAITGVPIVEGYGLSETSPVATCELDRQPDFNGTIGLPFRPRRSAFVTTQVTRSPSASRAKSRFEDHK